MWTKCETKHTRCLSRKVFFWLTNLKTESRSMFNMKYQSQPVTGCVLFGSLVINPLAATIPHYSFNKTKQHTHKKENTGRTNVAGAAPKCRGVLALSSPLPRRADGCTACKPRLSCDARSPDAPHRLLRPRHSWHPRAVITTLRPRSIVFMNAGSAFLSRFLVFGL